MAGLIYNINLIEMCLSSLCLTCTTCHAIWGLDPRSSKEYKLFVTLTQSSTTGPVREEAYDMWSIIMA